MALWSPEGAASEMIFGGQVTLSTRETKSDTGTDTQQFGLTTNINGKGYIWRPWYATLDLKLDLTQNESELAYTATGEKEETVYQLVSGDATLNLFPQSRFPLLASVLVSDSRVETDRVGVPLDEIDTLRRERVYVVQRYRPERGTSQYNIKASRNWVLENDADEEVTRNGGFTGVHHFKAQTLDYDMQVQEVDREESLEHRINRESTLDVRHGYRPGEGFAVESSVGVSREEERFERSSSLSDQTLSDRFSQVDTGSAATFMNWRPENSKWSMRTNLGVQRRERIIGSETSGDRASNAAAGAGYRFTDHLRLDGNAGISRNVVDGEPVTERDFQDVSLVYAPAPIPLGVVDYHWNTRGAVSNNDSNIEPSVQSATVEVLHGIEKIMSNEMGRTVSMTLNQGANKFRDSEGRDLATFTHSGSVAGSWQGRKVRNRTQLILEDTRVSGVEAKTVTGERLGVKRKSQRANLVGGHESSLTRSSYIDGDFSVSTNRIVDNGVKSRIDFARAGAGYTYNHLFVVERLRFRSRLEYATQSSQTESEGVREKEEDETRSSWDNRVDYTIGLLSLALRRTLTSINGKETVTVALSATRKF